MQNTNEKFTFTNKISLIGIILSTLLSIISLIVACLGFSYTIKKDKINNAEAFDIMFVNIGNEHAPQYKKRLDALQKTSSTIPQYYNIILSNISNKKSSIVDCKVFKIINGENIYFSDLVQGMYTDQSEEQNIKYPITLDSGESKQISLKLNLFIKKNVDQIIQKKYSYDTRIVFSDLTRYLYENEKDIYGNDMDVRISNDNNIIAQTINDQIEFPMYMVDFTTSKSKHFKKVIGINNFKNY